MGIISVVTLVYFKFHSSPQVLSALAVASPYGGGSTICSSNSLEACSYTSDCSKYANGSTCEHNVSCNGSVSNNNVYTCKNSKWVYTSYTSNGSCNFCIAPTPTSSVLHYSCNGNTGACDLNPQGYFTDSWCDYVCWNVKPSVTPSPSPTPSKIPSPTPTPSLTPTPTLSQITPQAFYTPTPTPLPPQPTQYASPSTDPNQYIQNQNIPSVAPGDLNNQFFPMPTGVAPLIVITPGNNIQNTFFPSPTPGNDLLYQESQLGPTGVSIIYVRGTSPSSQRFSFLNLLLAVNDSIKNFFNAIFVKNVLKSGK